MTETARNPMRKWLWIVIVSILLAGTATAALFAVVLGNHAVDCVNQTLGARSGLTILSASAQRDFAAADRTYNVVIDGLITHPARTPAQQASQRAALIRASAAKATASDHYFNAMNAIIATATAHPLGRC